MRYVVVGAGAIGGTVGARLARDGHDVLFCDADPLHVEAIERNGLTVEGPVEQLSVRVPAVLPNDLPESLGAVLLAVKANHTQTALAAIAPRLAHDGFVVSLQNGINEHVIAEVVGAERTVGAFVNFGADYIGPGRIFLGGKGAFYVGEVNGRPSQRVERLVGDIQDARATDAILGYLWSKQAYGAMLFATAVSGPANRRCPRRAPLPAALRAARGGDARSGAGRGEGLRRVRPHRRRGLDRAPGRVQPALGQDAHTSGCRPRSAGRCPGSRGRTPKNTEATTDFSSTSMPAFAPPA